MIQVHLVNENEDKIVLLLEKLKLLSIIVSDGDVLFEVEYSEMSNSFQEAPRSCLCYKKKKTHTYIYIYIYIYIYVG